MSIDNSTRVSRSVAASQREKYQSENKYKRILLSALTLGLLLFFGIDGIAQSTLDVLIENTLENNKTLLSAQKYYEAEVIEARTGNSPYNPEVEYAYLWGSPAQLGDRVDFAVTQSFDFPTAYSSRSKLSKISRAQASLRLETAEQDVIVRTRQAWIIAVYLNQRQILLKERLENAELIANAFERMFQEGEANQLQLNQAKLKATSLSNEMNRLQMEVVKNNAIISQLNGGDPFFIGDSIFPVQENIILDTLIKWYQSGPQNSTFQVEVSRMEQQKDVVFNQKLPKLKAGYYQETILGTQLKGITAGITIPLWENANAVKSAKAGLIYAQADAIRFWEQQELQIRQLYEQWLMLNNQVDGMRELLLQSHNDELLLKALESGEIALTQYYYESDFYFQNQFELIDIERDLQLLEAELLRVSY